MGSNARGATGSGVAVAEGVGSGVAVAAGVGSGVAVAAGVGSGAAVAAGVGSGVAAAVAVGVGASVAVGSAVAVGAGASVVMGSGVGVDWPQAASVMSATMVSAAQMRAFFDFKIVSVYLFPFVNCGRSFGMNHCTTLSSGGAWQRSACRPFFVDRASALSPHANPATALE